MASDWVSYRLIAAGVVMAGSLGMVGSAQVNSLPNPYRTIENWAKLPEGRMWGQTSAVDVDPGGAVWVTERCGGSTCAGRIEDPVLKFDQSGRLVKSFGSGMLVFPHGIFADRDGNIWITDGQGKDGKGDQIFKFSPDGRVLMTLGTAGVAEDNPQSFQPEDVVVAPNGDIFVADGHSERIVKFSKDGKFIKTWGKKGSGSGDFSTPHNLALDSRGRLFVCDRGNNRIQIFSQDGVFLEEWTQFGRPSGIFIDKNDTIYVTDSDSNATRHPGWKRGIRIGSARNGSVIAFIPDSEPDPDRPGTAAAEGVAVDANGQIYAAGPKQVRKYMKN